MNALRAALESALVENPDDLATHMAYADLLSEQGDPRGEFIQVQLALEDPRQDPERRAELQKREKELLDAYQSEWIGETAAMFLRSSLELEEVSPEEQFGFEYHMGHEYLKLHFVRGWIDSLELENFNAAFAEALGRSPTLGLLRQLTILETGDDEELGNGYAELARWPCLGGIRHFRLGPEANCHIDGAGILPALEQMQKLEELFLCAHRVEIERVFAVAMPWLRHLTVNHLRQYPFEILANNASLGNLVSLACWPHALEPHDRDGYITADAFTALVRSPHLKSLTQISLYLTEIGDRGIKALVESGMLRRLRVLNLWSGCITDEGAKLLATSPDIKRLQKLRLSQNMLTAEGIAALTATGVPLEANNQYDPNNFSPDEKEYLFEGDCE